MTDKQQTLPTTDIIQWKEKIISKQIVKNQNGQALDFVPCTVTAEITERGYILFSCDCEDGKKGKACEHILRAIGGDINLPVNRHDESQHNALIRIWKTAFKTQIYEIECVLYEKKEALSENNKKMKNLRGLLLDDKSSNIEEIKEKLKMTREQGIIMQNEIMKLEAYRDHLYTYVGVPLQTHNKAKNATRLLETLTKGNSDRSIFLPLFLPEDINNCDWFLYPCSALATPLGLVEIERTKQIIDDNGKTHTKKYTVRVQSRNFSLSAGDIFYDTYIARNLNVSWREALSNITTVVQISSIKNEITSDDIVTLIDFTIWNPHTKETVKRVMPIANFIRYLIVGDNNEQ